MEISKTLPQGIGVEVVRISAGQVEEAYPLVYPNGVPTIQVCEGDCYGVRVINGTSFRIGFILSLDGHDIVTGQLASIDSRTKFIIEPYDSSTLKAWVVDNCQGRELIFTQESESVAAHTTGNLGDVGTITLAIFFDQAQTEDLSIFYGSDRGGGPATGAGDYIPQQITRVDGLREPVLASVYQIRYVWGSNSVGGDAVNESCFEDLLHHLTDYTVRGANLGNVPNPKRLCNG